jgi:hypothetical protein
MNWKPFFGPQGGPSFPDLEFEVRDRQGPPDFGVESQRQTDVSAIPIGEPPGPGDVRAVFDSRFPNAYDFNFTKNFSYGGVSALGFVIIPFIIPFGYRAVVREYTFFTTPIILPVGGSDGAVQIFPQVNGGDVPNNSRVFTSGASSDPLKVFYLAEEGTSIGIRWFPLDAQLQASAYDITVQVYGNLLPVTGESLPYAVTNRIPNK